MVVRMFALRPLRRAALLTGVAALASALVTPALAPRAETHDRMALASSPTNAGKVYRWGDSQWHDGFTEPLTHDWKVNRPRLVRNQHGMLTLNGAQRGDVTATYTGHARRYGRWETRIRSKQFATGHTPYRVVAELVPAGSRPKHCGADSITPASYGLASNRAHMYIRTLPDNQFSFSKRLHLRNESFHTYAVEVTKKHISWFVDTHVVMTERRPAALSGQLYSVRFRLAAVKGARMNPGRMQMDWIRYYTLERRNAKSIDAPRAKRGVYTGAC
jgi:hypothetical protein